ncbi:MAG: (d)CMP kinase [Desulfobacterales bacterium]|jgi:CMP/dCMP kinase|nr:(d)CMP kinase [Desulfobacteraceae bacterium]MBT4364299.1 (d)CMP kinase [Desulfobacteraceae bacterium]MBT7086867.1 (d)CMP kinase [Desulfobacterales bacterium]MBT7697635.1 (d)CMP kinase [Desulfobacterales bacterium]
MKKLVVTIDGPAGAGKTTTSKKLAELLGYRYIDTGALYRGIAYEVREKNIDPENAKSLEELCSSIKLNLINNHKGLRIISGNMDISDYIRTPEISMLASAVSAKPVVREFLLELQREMGREKNAVFEGRDMGTIVFPEAEVKFFLSASDKARALRRYLELCEISPQTLEEVERDMILRDKNDSSRVLAPLKPAEDAIIIDATDLSIDQVINLMLTHINNY